MSRIRALVLAACLLFAGTAFAGPADEPVAVAGGPYATNIGEVIQFDGSGSFDPEGGALSYVWDFGDGSTDTGPHPTHTYVDPGDYTVTLTVTDDELLSAADEAAAHVNSAPQANAGGPYAGNIGDPIQFDGTGSSDPEADSLIYLWDFGDGETGSGPTPSHVYASGGQFVVTLQVTDSGLLSDSDTAQATVNVGPTAEANGPYSGAAGEAIGFSSAGSFDPEDEPLTYLWDFGDGATSTQANPSHAYASGGSFTATLRVTDSEDLFDEDTAAVTVTQNQSPTAQANGPYSGNVGDAISFSSAGSSDPDGDQLTYRWDFGDGSTSTQANPSHTYATGGSFTATLRVTDPGDLFDEDTAQVTVNRPPTANANGPYSGEVGDPIAFSSAGSSDPDGDSLTFRWDFGDGSTSTQANPSHSYATNGPFTATLRVTDPDDLFDEDTASVSVTQNLPPTAEANGPYSGNQGASISFSSAGSSDPEAGTLTYQWDFGDGSTSTQANPSHVYATGGSFTATLRVTDPENLFDEDTAQVTINRPPVAEANGPYAGDVGDPIAFSSASTSDPDGGPLTYRWDFGDGTTSTQANPSHSYASSGVFTATLRATDNGGLFDEDTASVSVTQNLPPTAEANGPYSGNQGAAISFSSAGSSDPEAGTLTYRWDFGDGSTSTQANPSHTYSTGGSFTATLRVTDPENLFDEDTAQVTVNRPPVAEANGPYAGDVGDPIAFSSAGTSDPDGGPLTYRWDFGDGTTSTQANPSHSYASSGSFTATLRVTDNGGLFDEDTASVSVTQNLPPIAEANGPYSGNQGASISFSSAGSTDPEGGPLNYRWVFGDGTTSTQANPSHVYVTGGSFTATLRVTDPDNLFDEDTAQVTVNRPPTAEANGPYSGGVGDPIAFSSAGSGDLDGGPLTYRWDFGDGTTSTQANPSHSFAASGVFTATLRVTDSGGLFDEDQASVSVAANPPPTAEANGPYSGNQGAAISFSSSGSFDPEGDPLTYLWSFGDGTTSTQANPSHAYVTGGSFTVTLRVTDPDNLFDEDTAQVTVNRPPTAEANGPYFVNQGTAINFSSAGSFDPDGQTLTYLWTFGDGTTSTQANPTHTYAIGGAFTAILRVTDPGGLFDDDTAAVLINRLPIAEANGPYTAAINGPISFSSAGSSDPDNQTLTYRWDFGDGSTSTQANPTHTYATGGAFTATLRVTDTGGLFDDDTAQVTVNRPPTAEANGPYFVNQGTAINFSSAGSFDPDGQTLTYLWTFGDGTTSTQANPTHTYAIGGAFTAILRVTDPGGLFDDDTAAVLIHRPPTAEANGPYSGGAGDPIAFSSAGSGDLDGGPLTYLWSFGDGTTSNQANPTHAYAVSGIYTATLRVTDSDGLFDEDTASVSVDANPPPTAEANGPYSGNQGAAISFSSAGSFDPEGDPLTYLWSFGDGTTSTQANPSHAYVTGGTFMATLRVTDPDNLFDEDTAQVTVNRPPTAEANGPYSGGVGDPIAFSSAGSGDLDGGPLTYRWDFGDGTTSTQANPSHSYAASGLYTATLRVTDSGGLFDEDTASVSVAANPPPTAEANGPYSGNQGALISFSSAGSFDPEGDPLTYRWDFGDGTTSTQANPSHVYVTGGGFTATLRVTDPDNLFDEDTAQVTVNRPPTAEANGPYSGGAGDPIAFSSAGSGDLDGGLLTYVWNFGDGTTSTQANPTHVYAASGIYTATLRVTDSGGLFDEDPASVSVDANPPPTAEANGPYSGNQGAAISFSSVGSSDPEGDPLTYLWTFGDGTTSTQANPSHVYVTGGVFTATLRVTDPDNLFDEDTAQVTVNRPPTAEANGPYAGGVSDPIAFSSAGSGDLDGGLLTYLWNFGDGTSSTLANPTHSYVASGVFTATLRVTDSGGLFDEDTASVSVAANPPPTAEANGPYSANLGAPISFSSAGSSDPEGDPLTYLWTFGDGTTSTQANPSHAYLTGGAFTATLRVTDPDNLFDEDTAQVTVNRPPTAAANGPYAGNLNVAISFSSAGSSDPDGGTLIYLWSFGDGNSSTLANPTHTYATGGPFTVTLRVTDLGGLFGEDTAVANVNRPPVANAGPAPYNGDRGAPISFIGSGSTDPDGQTLTYLWSFGDGANSTLASPTHAYAAGGTYTATLRVTDPGGLFTEAPAGVLVQDITVTFPTTATSRSEGDTLTVRWNALGGVSTVLIEFRSHPDSLWKFVANRPASEGAFNWRLPDIGTQDATAAVFRVQRTTGAPLFDLSDPFTVRNRSFTITSPAGGERVFETTTFGIAWTTTGYAPLLRLEYRLSPSNSWLEIVRGLPNLGSYTWTVPEVTEDKDQVQIRVLDHADPIATAVPSAQFTIAERGLAVAAPLAGAVWSEGSTQQIQWLLDGPIGDVAVEWRRRPADSWTTIATQPASALSYAWLVPAVAANEIHAQVRIRETAAVADPTTTTSAEFTLQNRSILVSRPAAGDSISEHHEALIQWSSIGRIDTVQIEFHRRFSDPWELVVARTPNDGEFLWTNTPDVTADEPEGEVRITDVSATADLAQDASAPFLFVNRVLVTDLPVPGSSECEADTLSLVWDSHGYVPTVDIDWRPTTSSLWTRALSDLTNTGSATWQAPDLSAEGQIELRVRQSTDPTVEGLWGAFTLRNRTLVLLRPEGGAAYSEGDAVPITWTSDCLDSVRVEARRRPADPWELQGRGVYLDNGQIIWSVIRVDQEETQVQVRVSDAADPTTVFAESAPFTVHNRILDITRPTVTDSVSETQSVDVLWDWVGTLQRISIEYRLQPADPWTPIAGNLVNSGTYAWTVPLVDQDFRDAQLRVYDSNNPAVFDESDLFIVLNRALLLQHPAGGEVLTEAAPDTVRWETRGLVPEVTVSYRPNAAAPWQPLATAIANTGQFAWVLPDVTGNVPAAQVKVEHATDATIIAQSAPFQIIDRTFTVLAPAGGERWSEATTQRFQWSSAVGIDSVRIDLLGSDGTPLQEIFASTPNDGEELWLVPEITATLEKVSVRIADVRPPLAGARSANFTLEDRAITLESPAPAPRVAWRIGSRQQVRWTTTGAIDSVAIELGRTGAGGPFEVLSPGLANHSGGSFSWEVTEPESFDAVVRVRDLRSAQVVGMTPFAVYLYDLVPPAECADFDDSGNVSLDELLLVEEIVVGQTAASQADSLAADGTRDGRIDVRDLLCGADDMLAAERGGRGRPFADAGAEAAAAHGATVSLGAATGAVPVLIDARSAVAGVLLELDVAGGRAEATLGPDAGDARLDRVETTDGRLVLVLRRGTKGDWPAGELIPLTIRVQPGGGGEVAIALRRAEVIAADLTRLPVHLSGSAAQLVPARVALGVNRPNPFNPSTVIPFELPAAGQVTLEIYDVRGRLVRRLVNGQLPAGFHSATWDGRDHSGRGVASGLYLSMLRAGGETITRKLTLLR